MSGVYIGTFSEEFKEEDIGVVSIAIAVISVIAIVLGALSGN